MLYKMDGKKMTEAKKTITAVLIGAGSRGRGAYGVYALRNPTRLKFIAIAEKDEQKRKIFQEQHNISDEYVFTDWKDLLSEKLGKIAQVAFICTPDQMHFEPTIQALNLDYEIVLEKPIAPTLNECQEIASLAEKRGRLVQICHVLRFTPFWKKVKETIDSGKLGKIIHYDHSENISYWHFGHSFVRGAYKNKETSTPIVLAKTCHDLDLIYWLLNEKAIEINSIGELTYYKKENAPANTPERCTDGCSIANTCSWYAPRLYVDLEPVIRTGLYSKSRLTTFVTKLLLKSSFFISLLSPIIKGVKSIKERNMFPTNTITTNYSEESIMKALKEGPFGLCIYKTGNDVPDHQITTMNFPSGATASLTMHGFSEHEGREFRLFGTKGVLRGIFRNSEETIEFTDFLHGKNSILYKIGLSTENHGGGDFGIMDAFTSVLLGETTNEEINLTDVSSAMESHFLGFAAEDSRLNHKVILIEKYRTSD